MSEDLARWIEEQARITGRSRSSLVKQALERAQQAGPKPFMKWTGTMDGPADLSRRKGFSK